MKVLPPGTILQLTYLEERLQQIIPGHFIEIGPGSGEITSLLLKQGWTGTVIDYQDTTIEGINNRFPTEIQSGRLKTMIGDYLSASFIQKANLIISCMVIEHLNDTEEQAFMNKASTLLAEHGLMIGLVPSCPAYWGIEDEIAGHYRRYTRDSIQQLTERNGWKLKHLSGLTYPVSNILFPVSNFLVKRSEAHKLKLSKLDQTKLSGQRKVPFKTSFPSVLGLILNKHLLLPLHWLQKACSGSQKAMVLYFEATT
ncbi:class I SAM-dependent methyltransferase [Verrucomicrobia bacterium LW23]|nr:class I SAM-dependent methyltransferase [Verrucomicrobia bacterium LW23]